MPPRFAPPTLSLPGCIAVLAALVAIPASARAQQAGSDGDHLLVVARTVQPRIAYRGIPVEDHPVQVQATTFPGRVFHRTLDTAMGHLVGDGELGEVGSAGLAAGTTIHGALAGALPFTASPTRFGAAGAGFNTPLGGGAGAGAGGVVSGATRGLGTLIQGSLLPVTGAQSGGGR